MKSLIIPILIFFSIGLNAQTREVFESFSLQEERDLVHYVPKDYSEDKKYPLILVLDAEYLFDFVVTNEKFNTKLNRMPETIVVGIKQNNSRIRDCSFDEETGLPNESAIQFFDFISLELIPYLENKYSIAPFKMFVGYDITANFGNYFLFQGKSIFNSYVSISPSLAPEMDSKIPERLSNIDQNIFYTLVLEEEKNKNRQQILQLNTALKSITKENLHYFFDKYEGSDHISIIPYGIGKAFDNVFKLVRPITPKEYREKILPSNQPVFQYLVDKYEMIKSLLGYEKHVELNDIMAIYAGCVKKEDFESLKPLSELCKKEFPETMLGPYFEGEYYELIGEPKKAMKSFERAFLKEEIDFLTKDMALEKIHAIKEDFGY